MKCRPTDRPCSPGDSLPMGLHHQYPSSGKLLQPSLPKTGTSPPSGRMPPPNAAGEKEAGDISSFMKQQRKGKRGDVATAMGGGGQEVLQNSQEPQFLHLWTHVAKNTTERVPNFASTKSV